MSSWTPRTNLEDILNGRIITTPLNEINAHRNRFFISSAHDANTGLFGNRNTTFNVLDEIRLQINGIVNSEAPNFFGFMITPGIPQYNSDCQAIGSAEVQLRIYLNQ